MLSLYLRIFTEHICFRRACWTLIALVIGACTCFTAATIFQCTPVSRAWHRWSESGTCVNIGALWYAHAIYNILTDFAIVLMVPPVIFNLKLPLRQRLALTCIFGLGVIVCAASIFRMTTLSSSAYGADITAGSLVSTTWTTIESGLGVVCTNLPMLRTPLQQFFPHLFPSRTGTDRPSSRRGSRPSCWSNNEAQTSPTKLVPPPIPMRDSSLPFHTFGNNPYPPLTPIPVEQQCERTTTPPQQSHLAHHEDGKACEAQFSRVPGQQTRSIRTGFNDWDDHRYKAW